MNGEELDFRQIQFRTPENPSQLWMEWFLEEFARKVFRINIDPRIEQVYRLDFNVRSLPGLTYCIGESTPARWSRDKSDEAYGLAIPLFGKMTFCWDRNEAAVDPGAVFIGPAGDMLEMQSDTRFLSLHLSTDILRQTIPNFQSLSCSVLPPGTEVIRHLLNYISLMESDSRIASPDLGRTVATHVHDLVALALGVTREAADLASARGGSAARLATIKRAILASLSDPGLSASKIAAHHGLSTRYLHMLFERENTTYSTFVLDARLERAHRILCDSRSVGRSVSDIAYSVGFGDLSYFNRTFKRRFGATPTELRTGSAET